MKKFTQLVVFLLVISQIAQIGVFVSVVKAEETEQCSATSSNIFQIKLHVTESGYFNEKMEIRHSINVPANVCVEILTIYKEVDSSLETKKESYSKIHAFVLIPESKDDDREFESIGQIGPIGSEDATTSTSLFFPSEALGLDKFRLSCIFGDCDGMEHLVELIVNVIEV